MIHAFERVADLGHQSFNAGLVETECGNRLRIDALGKTVPTRRGTGQMGEAIGNVGDDGEPWLRFANGMVVVGDRFQDYLRQIPALQQTGANFGVVGSQHPFFRLGA